MTTLAISPKIYYLDRLRVFLTALVIVHHALVTYGASGSWYYLEPASDRMTVILMTIVVATNQSFFMGFFFFMSALFTESSYDRKGRAEFLKDRLTRLGLPLLFYTFMLGPVMNYLVTVYGHDERQSFFHYLRNYDDWIDLGVLWFVAALLFFTVLFDVYKRAARNSSPIPLPGNSHILLFAVALGAVSFVVRIFFPVGWTLRPLGWQLGHFPQYIALFSTGIIAARNRWLQMDLSHKKQMLIVPILMVVVGFPVMYAIMMITHSGIPSFSGGWHWQALMYGVWEQVTGVSIIVVMLAYAKEKWNTITMFVQRLSRSAFAVYIIHPLFLIIASLVLRDVDISKAYKALICIGVALPSTFLAGAMLVKVPGIRKIV